MQVARALHRHKATVVELEEAGKWMSAADLVLLITTARDDVEASILEAGFNPDTCKALHDVVLACTIFGYLPPIRLACIWSLLHPQYQGPCLHEDCKEESCQGNRLIITSRDPLQMHIHLPHHKNEGAWEEATIHFELPGELAKIMYMHVSKGHVELCQHYMVLGSPPCPFVFMTTTGGGLSSSSLNKHWQSWLKQQGGVPHLPPSTCRHIFVDERMSNERVEGPKNQGAAMAMGNTVASWGRYYHKQKHFHPRDCQAAVNAMDVWRQHVVVSCAWLAWCY